MAILAFFDFRQMLREAITIYVRQMLREQLSDTQRASERTTVPQQSGAQRNTASSEGGTTAADVCFSHDHQVAGVML